MPNSMSSHSPTCVKLTRCSYEFTHSFNMSKRMDFCLSTFTPGLPASKLWSHYYGKPKSHQRKQSILFQCGFPDWSAPLYSHCHHSNPSHPSVDYDGSLALTCLSLSSSCSALRSEAALLRLCDLRRNLMYVPKGDLSSPQMRFWTAWIYKLIGI